MTGANLDRLEVARGGRLFVRARGEVFELADPASMPYQLVLTYLQDGWPPASPPGATFREARLLFERWCAHFDLPSFDDAQRLAYLVDHYPDAIAYDLQHLLRVDLGELWRARRWRTLLAFIDRLPGHSWYSAAITEDEEHAKAMAEILANRPEGEEKKDDSPSWTTWTPEVAALKELQDSVNYLAYITVAANSEGKAPAPPKPVSRPNSPIANALRRVELERREAKHQSLVARMLPHKAQSKD